MAAARKDDKQPGTGKTNGGTATATTTQQRREQQRAEKLAALEEAVASGHLVVRPMTAKERTQWAARRKPTEATKRHGSPLPRAPQKNREPGSSDPADA